MYNPFRACTKIVGFALLSWSLSGTAGAAAEVIEVTIDQTVPVRLDSPAKTVVIGNPSIADINVESGSLVFVLGRSFGTTNIYAMDNDGKEVANFLVQVNANGANTVTMFKKAARQTMVCSGTCEAVPMIGDSPEHFTTITDETRVKAEMASGRR